MTPQVSTGSPSQLLRILDWVVRIVVGLAFIAAGGAKLAGVQPMVDMFETIGVGQWFRFVTGGLEIVGGLLVLLPRASVYGASLLVGVMVGAIFTHLVLIGGSPLPASVLLVLNVAVLWLRRDAVAGLLATIRG